MDEEEYSGTIPAIDKNRKGYYTGRHIRWFGTAGELAVVPLELVEETEGNIFDSGKIKNLEAMINSHDDFYELYAPVGAVHEVTLGDIIEDQRNVANDEFELNSSYSRDIGDAYTTYDDDLDEYLGVEDVGDALDFQSNKYLEVHDMMSEQKGYYAMGRKTLDAIKETLMNAVSEDSREMGIGQGSPEYDKVISDITLFLEMEERLARKIKSGNTDIGTYRISLRDGNHRFTAAKDLGERYIAIDLVDEHGSGEGEKVDRYPYLTPATEVWGKGIQENNSMDGKYPPSWSMPEYFRIWQYDGYEQAREYAGKHLKKIGCGEGRCAFKLDDTKVLKIAKDVKMGVRQNSFEIENISNNEGNQLTPEIYDFDDKYSRWLEMEYITPFKDDEDFMEVMGFLPYEAEDVFEYLYGNNKGDLDAFEYETQDSIEYLLGDNKYMLDFIELARGSNMAKSGILPDYMRPDHWGVNKGGEPKIMDLGFTYEYARFR